MPADVSDRHLRQFVVRLDHPNGGWGSGVLVAPGWVLTCAHVVSDTDLVTVIPDRGSHGKEGIEPPESAAGMVLARSESPQSESKTAFWPFPDLALIRVDEWTDHPIAPLIVERPETGSRPHTWGYGRREDGVEPVGSPASFVFEGEEGDYFYSLSAGDATPGLSGAPLVCAVHRGVVGVMTMSRRPKDPRGGWASPVYALPDVSGTNNEGTQHGSTVFQLNQIEGWKWRELWNRALPIHGRDDLIDRPWLNLDGPDRLLGPAPSIMLRPELGLVPFFVRDEAFKSVIDWARGPDAFAIAYFGADGGTGKTRWALELCKKLHELGWLAGWLPFIDRGVGAARVPRFVVVDYVEERGDRELLEQLGALSRSASKMSPVRVLLLSRPSASGPASSALDDLRVMSSSSGQVELAISSAHDISDLAVNLSAPDREALFREAMEAFGLAWWGPSWKPGTSRGKRTSLEGVTPLDVLLEAFDVALSTATEPANGMPLERALEHEQRHWRGRMRELDPSVLRLTVSLATLAGARTTAELDDLLDVIMAMRGNSIPRERLATWGRNLYRGDMIWNPLRPDRLGEALVRHTVVVDGDGVELIEAVLALTSDLQVAQALDVLMRLTDDAQMHPIIVSGFERRYFHLVERAERQSASASAASSEVGLLQGVLRMTAVVLGSK